MAEKASDKEKKRDELLAQQRETSRQLAELDGDEELEEEHLPAPPVPEPEQTKKPTQPLQEGPESDLDARRGPEDFFLAKNNEMVTFIPNHRFMGRPDQRQQDGKQQRFFFYRRLTDDRTLCFTEAEAATITSKGSTHRVILRMIGCSNGAAYAQSIRACGIKSGARIPLKQAQDILAKAYDAELESARGNFDHPLAQNVIFDKSFPMKQRDSFVPPA